MALPATRAQLGWRLVVAAAMAIGSVDCSFDILHSTSWSTACDLDPQAPGCAGGDGGSGTAGGGGASGGLEDGGSGGVPLSCSDGSKNGTETDRDCGGGHCPGCELGEECLTDTDCKSSSCTGGVCVLPTSCLAANGAGPKPTGVYTIDLDGPGPKPPLDVYCDMATAGGGWTLALNLDTSDGHVMWWADPLWADTNVFGSVGTALFADHKSEVWNSFAGATEILLVVHAEGRYLGWKSFAKVDGSTMHEHMLGADNTLIGTAVTGADPASIDPVERLVRSSTALYANHCVATGGGCVSGATGSPDGDRIGSHEATPKDNDGGGLGNWHDMGFCCLGADYGSGKVCNGQAFRTTSEAQAGWSPSYGNQRAFGSDTFGPWTCGEVEAPCGDSAYTCANGLEYDYALFLR